MTGAVREQAAIAFGGNLGEVERTFKRALARLEKTPGVVVLRRSAWASTAPVGGPPQPDYLNGVVLIETTLSARALLEELQGIERHLGRDRAAEERWGPRTLDLDLLLYGDARIDEDGLSVPHPRMEARAFVLEPLAALAPDWRLASGRTAAEARDALEAPAAGGAAEAAQPAGIVRLPDPGAARDWCAQQRSSGRSVGFVPTMGALHEGHLSLVERALADNDLACVSVFVNPLQFDDPEDLERYPRDLEADAELLAGVGCSMVFTGTLEGFFPGELDERGGLPPERLIDPGPAALGLEGEHRSGHFEGVATIVDRLFDVTLPTRAYFGQKDFQQCLVVRDLARRRGAPEIVVCPTLREPEGLARSSRNALLDDAGRAQGLYLSRALFAARDAWVQGERDPARLAAVLREVLDRSELEVEYAAVRDPEAWTAEAPVGPLERAVALIAARAGAVRLIDNLPLSAGIVDR